MLSTVLGLSPLVVGGKPEQHQRFLPRFLAAGKGAPLAAIRFDRTRRQRNVDLYRQEKAFAPPRGVWRLVGHLGPEAMDICGHRMERTGCRPAHRRLPHRCQRRTSRGISIIACLVRQRLVFEHAFDMLDTCPSHAALPAWTLFRFRPENMLGQEGGGLQLAAEKLCG